MNTNKQSPVKISPSIIASDLTVMGETVRSMDPGIIDLLHMDVMDGVFVPNLTFGPSFIHSLSGKTSIPLDVHLMIEKPENSIDEYIALSPWCITIHYESTRFPARIMQKVRENGIKSAVSINPATPVEAIFDIIPFADMVLIMSVDPGFYGQKFMLPALKRIKTLKAHIAANKPETLIQVDGGINLDNIKKVTDAGADIVVAGGSAFSGGDVNTKVRALKEAAQS